MLNQSYQLKIAEAFRKLRVAKEQKSLAMQKKSHSLGLILRGIARASGQKVNQAYHKLLDNNLRRADAESLNRTIVESQQFLQMKSKKKLFDRFLLATAGKKADAIARMRKLNSIMVTKSFKVSRLIKKLVAAQQAKVQIASQKLKKAAKIRTTTCKKLIEKL